MFRSKPDLLFSSRLKTTMIVHMPSKRRHTPMLGGSLLNTSATASVQLTLLSRMVRPRDSNTVDRVALDDSNPDHAEVLNKIKTRFREETFTRESIREVIHHHPELVSSHCKNRVPLISSKIRMLYINFAMTHCMYIYGWIVYLVLRIPQIPPQTKHPSLLRLSLSSG